MLRDVIAHAITTRSSPISNPLVSVLEHYDRDKNAFLTVKCAVTPRMCCLMYEIIPATRLVPRLDSLSASVVPESSPEAKSTPSTRTMASNQPGPKPQTLAGASVVPGESKARGANRSTKVAGKLKVLPEHAEPVLHKNKAAQPSAPPRDKDEAGEGSGTLADSEEEEAEEEEEPEDVEVSLW